MANVLEVIGRLSNIAHRWRDLLDGTYAPEVYVLGGPVGGLITSVSVTIAGHAGTGAYAANDVLGSIAEVPNLARVAGGQVYVTEVRLATNKKSITPRFRVHFFNAADPTVAADDAAHKELYADASKRLGFLELPAMVTAADTANSDMSRAVLQASPAKPLLCTAATRSVWVLLEPLDGFTPSGSESFTLVVVAEAY